MAKMAIPMRCIMGEMMGILPVVPQRDQKRNGPGIAPRAASPPTGRQNRALGELGYPLKFRLYQRQERCGRVDGIVQLVQHAAFRQGRA